ncbi:MAG: hypothetical protein Q8R48_05260, partial [Candidatus Omnitrophota bacterium]|nr:hypothetical protein [Candidatus Omnitrophota bacterium]
SYPQGIAIDAEDNVYVADTNNRRIQVFDSVGGHLRDINTGGEPRSIAVDEYGDIYLIFKGSSAVNKIGPNGSRIIEIITNGEPNKIAVDANGNIYITDTSLQNRYVWKFNQKDSLLTHFGKDGEDGNFPPIFPDAIAVDREGNIYATYPNKHTIKKFDSNGNFIREFGSFGTLPGKFGFPAGIQIGLSGEIYVADNDFGRIQVITPSQTDPSRPLGDILAVIESSQPGVDDIKKELALLTLQSLPEERLFAGLEVYRDEVEAALAMLDNRIEDAVSTDEKIRFIGDKSRIIQREKAIADSLISGFAALDDAHKIRAINAYGRVARGVEAAQLFVDIVADSAASQALRDAAAEALMRVPVEFRESNVVYVPADSPFFANLAATSSGTVLVNIDPNDNAHTFGYGAVVIKGADSDKSLLAHEASHILFNYNLREKQPFMYRLDANAAMGLIDYFSSENEIRKQYLSFLGETAGVDINNPTAVLSRLLEIYSNEITITGEILASYFQLRQNTLTRTGMFYLAVDTLMRRLEIENPSLISALGLNASPITAAAGIELRGEERTLASKGSKTIPLAIADSVPQNLRVALIRIFPEARSYVTGLSYYDSILFGYNSQNTYAPITVRVSHDSEALVFSFGGKASAEEILKTLLDYAESMAKRDPAGLTVTKDAYDFIESVAGAKADLISVLKHPDSYMRRAAASALSGFINDREVLDALKRALYSETYYYSSDDVTAETEFTQSMNIYREIISAFYKPLIEESIREDIINDEEAGDRNKAVILAKTLRYDLHILDEAFIEIYVKPYEGVISDAQKRRDELAAAVEEAPGIARRDDVEIMRNRIIIRDIASRLIPDEITEDVIETLSNRTVTFSKALSYAFRSFLSGKLGKIYSINAIKGFLSRLYQLFIDKGFVGGDSLDSLYVFINPLWVKHLQPKFYAVFAGALAHVFESLSFLSKPGFAKAVELLRVYEKDPSLISGLERMYPTVYGGFAAGRIPLGANPELREEAIRRLTERQASPDAAYGGLAISLGEATGRGIDDAWKYIRLRSHGLSATAGEYLVRENADVRFEKGGIIREITFPDDTNYALPSEVNITQLEDALIYIIQNSMDLTAQKSAFTAMSRIWSLFSESAEGINTEFVDNAMAASLAFLDTMPAYEVATPDQQAAIDACVSSLDILPAAGSFNSYGRIDVSQAVLDKIATALGLETGSRELALRSGIILISNDNPAYEGMSDFDEATYKTAAYFHGEEHLVQQALANELNAALTFVDIALLRAVIGPRADGKDDIWVLREGMAMLAEYEFLEDVYDTDFTEPGKLANLRTSFSMLPQYIPITVGSDSYDVTVYQSANPEIQALFDRSVEIKKSDNPFTAGTFPAMESVKFDELQSLNPAWAGRTMLIQDPADPDGYIAYKFARENETEADLQNEVDGMLIARNVLGDTPELMTDNDGNLIQTYSGDLTNLPEGTPLNPNNYFVQYKAKKDYFKYLNNEGLDYTTLLNSSKKNLTDLAKLFKAGYLHTSLVSFSHIYRDNDDRQWLWDYGNGIPGDKDGPGEIEYFEEHIRYSNLRLSGIADYEHITPVGYANSYHYIGQNLAEWMMVAIYSGLVNGLSDNEIYELIETSLKTFFMEFGINEDIPETAGESINTFIIDMRNHYNDPELGLELIGPYDIAKAVKEIMDTKLGQNPYFNLREPSITSFGSLGDGNGQFGYP